MPQQKAEIVISEEDEEELGDWRKVSKVSSILRKITSFISNGGTETPLPSTPATSIVAQAIKKLSVPPPFRYFDERQQSLANKANPEGGLSNFYENVAVGRKLSAQHRKTSKTRPVKNRSISVADGHSVFRRLQFPRNSRTPTTVTPMSTRSSAKSSRVSNHNICTVEEIKEEESSKPVGN